eukprot:3113574-Pleurochrysis_carterae.AAC.1
MANAWRSAIDGAYTLGKGLAHMAQMRRNIPHGVAACSVLLAIMALISYGDAAVADRFASVSDEQVAQQVYSTAMQSLPAGAAPINAKSKWLGDTGARMHCITDVRMAVAGSVHANSTLIVTANGTTRPKYRCDVDLPLRTDKGAVVTLRLKNVLVLDNASHNLVSLG